MGNYRGPGRTTSTLDDPVAALEADVMRFVAILGLCLMIIFALVQSIPVSSANNQPQLLSRELLEKEIAELVQQANKLRDEIVELNKALDQTRKKSGNELQIMKQELSELRQKLDDANNDLQSAAKKLAEQQEALTKVESIIQQVRQKLENVQRKYENIKSSVSKKQPETAAPATVKSTRGFSLRFETEAVLKDLVRKKRIKFYMLASHKSWRLASVSGRGWQFSPGNMSGSFYEMQRNTVPEDFVKAARMVVALGGAKAKYGVVLPGSISGQLVMAMEGREGGDLVIGEGGKVSIR